MYAKLIDGNLVYAENPIRVNGMDIFTNDPTPYGYKPVQFVSQPSREGYIASMHWVETETSITQEWVEIPRIMPENVAEERDNAEPISMDDSVAALEPDDCPPELFIPDDDLLE